MIRSYTLAGKFPGSPSVTVRESTDSNEFFLTVGNEQTTLTEKDARELSLLLAYSTYNGDYIHFKPEPETEDEEDVSS